jgi:hypothetical protein
LGGVHIVSRSLSGDKELFYRFPKADLLFDTCIPDLHEQRLIGSLVALLFKDPKVENLSIHQEGDGSWIADVVLQYSTGWREYYRGEGNTPLTAVTDLVRFLMIE